MDSKLLDQGIEAYKNGNRQLASKLLKEFVSLEPENERAWMWLAASLDKVKEKRYCLEKAVALNPKNEFARRALRQYFLHPRIYQSELSSVGLGETVSDNNMVGNIETVHTVPPTENESLSQSEQEDIGLNNQKKNKSNEFQFRFTYGNVVIIYIIGILLFFILLHQLNSSTNILNPQPISLLPNVPENQSLTPSQPNFSKKYRTSSSIASQTSSPDDPTITPNGFGSIDQQTPRSTNQTNSPTYPITAEPTKQSTKSTTNPSGSVATNQPAPSSSSPLSASSTTPPTAAPIVKLTLTPTNSSPPIPTKNNLAKNQYYVSITGNDANSCSIDQPCKTIQHAVDKLAIGDTLYVRAGVYNETFKINASGNSSSPITVSSYPGETAVIDGNNSLPTNDYGRMIMLAGDYIILNGFEVRNSRQRGIEINGAHDIVRNNNIHHAQLEGIYSAGAYAIVEKNKVWRTVEKWYSNHSGAWSAAVYFGAEHFQNLSPYFIARNNEVFQNSGEGILSGYTDYGIIENNIVWDNWAIGIYLDQSSYLTVRNNLVYYTSDKQYWRYEDRPGTGILYANEAAQAYPVGHDNKTYNNIVVNAGRGIGWWAGWDSASRIINDSIVNNTIVSNNAHSGGIWITSPASGYSHSGTVIENNLVSVLDLPLEVASQTGLIFSNNLWSKTPAFLSSGDVVENPLMNGPTHSVDNGIDPNWYSLTANSPAIGKALVVSVLTDYFGRGRDSSPDIGAFEFVP